MPAGRIRAARQSRRWLRRAAPAPAAARAERRGISLEQFAAHAAMVVRANGWVSRERARRSSRPASADAALHSLQATPDAPQAADLALAGGALRWARELLASQPRTSTFERDAVAVANASTVLTRRERGLVCALIAMYRGRRLRSRHLGEVGDWLTPSCSSSGSSSSRRRATAAVCRHDLIDVDGNRLVWWQTRGTPLPAGRAIHLRGRVERHTHFGRTAITVLARCRALDRRPHA